MLRANLLKTFNNNIKEKGLMDYWFERLGGTYFTNCYTPVPDSPRSIDVLPTLIDIMDDRNSYSFDGISLFKEAQI